MRAFGWVFPVSTFFFGDGFRCLLHVVRCLVPCLVLCVQIQQRAEFDGVSLEDRRGATFGFFFVVGVVFFFGVLEWLMVVFLLVLVSFVFAGPFFFCPVDGWFLFCSPVRLMTKSRIIFC